MSRILLLGGTHEARGLATAFAARGLPFVVSLAGRTKADYPGEVRIGGFGGAEGLAAYLRAERISLVLDATHPFAAEISPNAARAASVAGIPYLRLERPPWPTAGAIEVPSLEAAAGALAPGTTAFLAVGAGSLAPFLARRDVRLVVRAVEPPALGDRTDVVVIRARGPFTPEGEQALWNAHGIETLVTKNSGGAATDAKLEVARQRGTRIVMIARPAGQPRPDAASVEEMLTLLERRL